VHILPIKLKMKQTTTQKNGNTLLNIFSQVKSSTFKGHHNDLAQGGAPLITFEYSSDEEMMMGAGPSKKGASQVGLSKMKVVTNSASNAKKRTHKAIEMVNKASPREQIVKDQKEAVVKDEGDSVIKRRKIDETITTANSS
jgi:hypothetical protein